MISPRLPLQLLAQPLHPQSRLPLSHPQSVRQRIRALVGAEPAADVLSDDAIVAVLRGEGVDIARRTVAKYREALRIPSSVQRKREKAAHV